MPNGQFCRRNLRRLRPYDFLHRHGLGSRRDTPPRHAAGHTATRGRTQQFMLRGRLKTVDSYRAGGPNRDKPHFGDA
ncbi:hypothetical protein [Burkholderia cepacia]|uniref:hypothetical protein n=1 Tax=Burkholderia cepacia TaxID=292 RepID=UPI000ABFACBA|nr:hypothetical protein [Burkholderia cepacia]